MIHGERLTSQQRDRLLRDVAAHHTVRAEGQATVTSAGPPVALSALDVKFETP